MTKNKEQIQESFNKWEEGKVNKSIARFPERKEKFEFDTGQEMKRLYTPLDAEFDYENDLGYPGQYPYTRVFNLQCIEENSGL